MNVSHGLASLMLGLALAGCASGPPDQPERKLPAGMLPATKKCISVSNVYDWRPLDSYGFILQVRRHEAYYVEMFTRCHGLTFTHGIAFDSRSGRLCGTGDSVILAGNQAETCPIKAIYPLEGDGTWTLQPDEEQEDPFGSDDGD